MGLLSFLTRRQSPDKLGSLKGQAYSSTTASVPPVRGTIPVAGNGARMLENIRLSQLGLQRQPELAAPAPFVPRCRGESLERPSSAPQDHQSSHVYTPFQPPRKDSLRGSSRGPGARDSFAPLRSPVLVSKPETSAYRTSEHGSDASLPRAPFRRERSESVRSERAFVDILDAQSGFKPADFRTRVKAAGVRDYGEDVADRNIGANGVDLSSREAQAFYASVPSSSSYLSDQSAPAPAVSRHHRTKGTVRHQQRPHDAVQSAIRTKSLNSASLSTLPLTTLVSPPVPSIRRWDPEETDVVANDRDRRRQTITTYVPTGATGSTIPNQSRSRSRPTSAYRSAAEKQTKPPVAANTSQRRQRRRGSIPGESAADIPPVPPLNQEKHANSPKQKQPRDSILVAKRKSRESVRSLKQQGFPIFEHFSMPPLPDSEPNSRRGSVTNSMSTVALRGRRSVHTFRPSTSSSIRCPEVSADSAPFTPSSGRAGVLMGAVGHEAGYAGDTDSSPRDAAKSSARLPYMGKAHVRHGSLEARVGRPRTRSLASHPGNSRLDEIYEYMPVPTRRSSLRHYSLSSTTPTSSDASSNPFPRPVSRHTANTSIDVGPLRENFNASKTSFISHTATDSYSTAPESHVTSPTPPLSLACGNADDTFNIDDYVSSDDDSFADPGQPHTEGEELLFRDDGFGSQLPGLFDAAPAPVIRTCRPSKSSHHVETRSLPYFPQAYKNEMGSQLSVVDDDDDDDDDDDEDGERQDVLEEDDEPGNSSDSEIYAIARQGLNRLSEIGSLYSTSVSKEQRKEEKVDIATAVRLRKEAKSRQRAQLMAERRSPAVARGRTRTRGKGTEVV